MNVKKLAVILAAIPAAVAAQSASAASSFDQQLAFSKPQQMIDIGAVSYTHLTLPTILLV